MFSEDTFQMMVMLNQASLARQTEHAETGVALAWRAFSVPSPFDLPYAELSFCGSSDPRLPVH